MKGQNLRQLYESLGPVECVERLNGLLDSRKLRPEDFSLRELAEAFCGYDWVRALNPSRSSRFAGVPLLEAGDGIDVTAFANITGQMFFNKIREGWQLAAKVADKIFDTVTTQLDGEKMPWLANVTGEGEEVRPGGVFPETAFGERYIETPRTTKFGQILSITKEAIFFDLTGQMNRNASTLGERLSYNKEKRCLRVFLGLVNNYKLNGTAYNTYQTSTWTNAAGSNQLLDYTSINQAYILASRMLDPDTSNPILIDLKNLFVMPAKVMSAKRIVTATEVRDTNPGFTTTGDPVQTASGNPLPDTLDIITSPIAYQLMYNAAATQNSTYAGYVNDVWTIGDFKKAFAYMENWPLTVVQSPPNSIKEFEQDIVLRFKASERGTPAVIEPRQVFQFYGSGTLANGVFA